MNATVMDLNIPYRRNAYEIIFMVIGYSAFKGLN
jgi:hypothetical protein